MIAALAALFLVAAPLPPPDAEVFGPMDFETLDETMAQLGKAMGGDHKPEVTLRISSPGGNAIATLLFIDKVQDMKARQGSKVRCVGSVMVASAAAILFESPVCDYRVAAPATVFLFHGVATQTSGKIQNVEDDLALMRALDEGAAALIYRRLGFKTAYEYLAWIAGRDRWVTPHVLLEMGGVDELLD